MRAPIRLLAPALLAVVAASALGCQESGFDERKETARPLKVQHGLGESKVPGQAERPLPLTVDSLDNTLALEARPVAAALPGARPPAYLRAAAHGVELVEPVTGAADIAPLEALDPDVILGSETGQAAVYDELSRIAPTVITQGGGGQWKLNVRLIGEALGRTNDAERLLIDYDRRVAQVRRAARTADKPRVAVAHVTGAGLRFAKRDSFAGTILADAGLEQVARDDRADVMLVSAAPGQSVAGIAGRFQPVDDALWWGPGGTLAARAALADLRDALLRRALAD